MKIKLGISPINWSNDDDPSLGKDISFEQSIAEMAEAGFRGTELGSKFPRDVALLKEALQKTDLALSSAWFSTYFTEEGMWEKTLSQFLDHLSFVRALGASFINVCECGHAIQGQSIPILGADKPKFNQRQWPRLIQGLHTIGRMAHEFGMHVVYHHHAGTGVFYFDEIDMLMRHTSPELISLLLDTGHTVMADIDPLQVIAHFGHRIHYVHLKDIRLSILNRVASDHLSFMDGVRAGVFTVPGDGDIDFVPIIEALDKLHYSGWMIVEAEQDPFIAPPLIYAQKAMTYLTHLFKTVTVQNDPQGELIQ